MEYTEYPYWDSAYKALVDTIYYNGIWTDTNVRTKYADGTPATYKAVAGVFFKLDNSKDDAFLLTTKHVAWKTAVKEMYWIYIIQSNKVKDLQDMGVEIWTPWAKEDGTIGPAYGAIISKPTFGYKNQLEYVVETLKKDPNSRRVMINLWDIDNLPEMALTPCCYNLLFNLIYSNSKYYISL